MDQVEPQDIYDERGATSRARPLLQGDVFDGIVLPGFDEQPLKVQIVAHPCAMRVGADLAPRITVAPVVEHKAVVGSAWDGNLRVMPLAELADGKHYATNFVDVTAAPTGLLTRANRIATLSHKGIFVLQQRLIKHYTRLDMPLDLLRKESAPTLVEAEMQWHWVEEVLNAAELSNDEQVDAEARVFDDWCGVGTPSPRARLKDEYNHASVRKETRAAALARAESRQAEA